jgi:hypothetical protein
MADDEDEEEREPIVELGEKEEVEGAPLARVSSRLTWGIEKSRLEAREGDTEIRTPEGPKRLGDVLDAVEKSYFTRRQDFEDTIEGAVGTGPIPTAENGDATRESTDGTDTGTTSEDSSDSGGDRSTDSTGSDGEDDADPDLQSGTDADQGTDSESQAMAQGAAHAETSSATDSESETDGDDAGSEE